MFVEIRISDRVTLLITYVKSTEHIFESADILSLASSLVPKLQIQATALTLKNNSEECRSQMVGI
jgi:hypothetical protein